jgi:hypothetical protein
MANALSKPDFSARRAPVNSGWSRRRGQLAQPHAAHLRTGQHRDGVGVKPLYDAGNCVHAADRRNFDDVALRIGGSGDAGRDDGQSVITLAPQHDNQVRDDSAWPTTTTFRMQLPSLRSLCSRLRSVNMASRSSSVTAGRAMTT